MNYRYSYIIMDSIFLLIWLIPYIWRKDLRKNMLTLSLIFAALSWPTELIYRQDWWGPLTITKTNLGVEDLLFGFTVAGIGAVFYEAIFKLRLKKHNVSSSKFRFWKIFSILLLAGWLFLGAIYLLHLNSLIASVLTFILPTLCIYYKRPDLIRVSVATGLILVFIVMITYSIVELITPGWIVRFWYFQNTPRLIYFNMPLDDIIWYFFAGLLTGSLYEYWQEKQFVKIT